MDMGIGVAELFDFMELGIYADADDFEGIAIAGVCMLLEELVFTTGAVVLMVVVKS